MKECARARRLQRNTSARAAGGSRFNPLLFFGIVPLLTRCDLYDKNAVRACKDIKCVTVCEKGYPRKVRPAQASRNTVFPRGTRKTPLSARCTSRIRCLFAGANELRTSRRFSRAAVDSERKYVIVRRRNSEIRSGILLEMLLLDRTVRREP